jgi:LPS sulfotransferase NodH
MTNNAVEAIFPELIDYKSEDYYKIGTDKKVIMIAMTARSGSSHLCSSLDSILNSGKLMELFNARDNLVYQKSKYSSNSFGDLLASALQECDDVYIFKTNWIDFQYFLPNISKLFRNLKIIYLDRLDIVAQAVSLHLAQTTNRWHISESIDASSSARLNELLTINNNIRICANIDDLTSEKHSWECYFHQHLLQPLRIFYEFLDKDMETTVKQICLFADILCPDSILINSKFNRLSSPINEALISRIRYYRSGSNILNEFSLTNNLKDPAIPEIMAGIDSLDKGQLELEFIMKSIEQIRANKKRLEESISHISDVYNAELIKLEEAYKLMM